MSPLFLCFGLEALIVGLDLNGTSAGTHSGPRVFNRLLGTEQRSTGNSESSKYQHMCRLVRSGLASWQSGFDLNYSVFLRCSHTA